MEKQFLTDQISTMPSLFSFKLIDRVIIPVGNTSVDAAVFLTFFLLLLISAGVLFSGIKRIGLARRIIQCLSSLVFLLFFHQCLCIMRDWAFGFQQIGRDNTAAFGNLFLPVLLIVSALVMGRIFCGFICPMGLLVELFSKLGKYKKFLGKKADYILLSGLTLLSIVFSYLIWPDNRFVYESTAMIWTFLLLGYLFFAVNTPAKWRVIRWPLDFSLYLWMPLVLMGVYVNNPWCSVYASNLEYASMAAFVVTLLASAVFERAWCRFVCPLGAVLRFVSSFSHHKRVATNLEKKLWGVCPSGALDPSNKDGFDFTSCIYCGKCISNEEGFNIK